MAHSKFCFSSKVLAWFDVHGRHNLPWQKNRSLYNTWIAEVMLQQTQVKTVIPYYEKFLKSFPSITELGNSSLDTVLNHWAGLGYYSRARNLHASAKIILEKHTGVFPDLYDDVLALPGIGPSTAGAILAQALDEPFPILDGNVKRVLCRFHAIEGVTSLAKINHLLWEKAKLYTPENRAADYTQAIMDLGATICQRSSPKCSLCPLSEKCDARKNDAVELYPTKKVKKSLPVKQVQLLVVNNNLGAVLLEKRPPSGIWGGLWSLPETSLEERVDDFCSTRWNLQCEGKSLGKVFRHTFSHYHLDITPCWVMINDKSQNSSSTISESSDLAWCKPNQLEEFGVAAPISMLLQQHFELLDSKRGSRLNTHP